MEDGIIYWKAEHAHLGNRHWLLKWQAVQQQVAADEEAGASHGASLLIWCYVDATAATRIEVATSSDGRLIVRFGQSYWSIESLDWAVEQSPECVSLVSPSEVGAFQISCYRKRQGMIEDVDIARFRAEAATEAPGAEPVLGTFGEFAGFTVTHEAGGTYWRRWWLWHGAVNLFATYNCELAARGREDNAVDQLLASLRASAA